MCHCDGRPLPPSRGETSSLPGPWPSGEADSHGNPDSLPPSYWLTLSTGEQVQVGREKGRCPPEGEAALGGGAGDRVPEDPRCLRPAGPHQPGAAQEGAVSQLWAVCSDLPGLTTQLSPSGPDS